MTNLPLLSIVIATKNREKYCIEAIKSILSIPTDLIEITIADNSATEDVGKFITENLNDRVVYRYDNSEISSIENFNRAMELATGEYVCLIGDDDTVLPVILDAVKWAKENNVDSLCSNNYLHYYWPGAQENYPNGLFIMPEVNPRFYQVDIKKELNRLIRNGLVNYVFYSLPKTYHGIVKRAIMLQIKGQTGHFYGGLSPDIYSVIAVSCLAKNHFTTTVPLTIAGVCATSTTADNLTGKHSSELENMPHLKNRGHYVWDNNIPAYYSVSTIWAESGLKALADLNRPKLYNRFNRYPSIAQGILMNRKYILSLALKKTMAVQKEKEINIVFFWFHVIWSICLLVVDKIKRVIKLKFRGKNKEIENVIDISNAVSITAITSPYKEGINWNKMQ